MQLSDTHVVAKGANYLRYDSARFLEEAIAAVNALVPRPAFAVVTGDLCHAGSRTEYEHFVELFAALRVPYYVLPGNHDNVDKLVAVLPPRTFGETAAVPFRYALDAGGVRLVALDSTAHRAINGFFDAERLDWLEATLARMPGAATVVALHQPPFRTGMHYMDVMPYPGATRLRSIVERNPHVALVIGGHIHCVRAARWNTALAMTAPSTSPQLLPELFERHVFALRSEAPGFVLHRRLTAGGFEAIVHRREAGTSRYVPTERALCSPPRGSGTTEP